MYYHLTPYKPEVGQFYLGKNKGTNLFNEANANEIRNYYQQKLMINDRVNARLLEQELNNALINQSQSYNNLIMSFIERLNNINFNNLLNKGYMKAEGTNITLNKTKINSQEYENEFRQIVQQIFPDKDIIKSEDIRTVTRRLNSHLITLRKNIFENLLSDMLENIGNEISRLSEKAIDTLVQQIQTSLNSKSQNIKVNIPDLSSQVDLILQDRSITVNSPKGDVNVAITGLSGDIDSISGGKVRNYSSLNSKVSFISRANISGLIENWPNTSSTIKNLALNGLSGRDPFPEQFSIMKDIFLLQSMAGISAEKNLLNDYIIIGTKKKDRPIAVFSVAELYFGGEGGGGLDPDFAEFSEIAPIENVPRSQADFSAFVANTRISVRTKMSLGRMLKSY